LRPRASPDRWRQRMPRHLRPLRKGREHPLRRKRQRTITS